MKKFHHKLAELEIGSSLIHGGTPVFEREAMITEFKELGSPISVLITNPATLGESISLHQSVHDAVYLEFDFNLVFMLQSRDRIHRLGLPDGQYTRYYYLMTAGERHLFDNRTEAEMLDPKLVEQFENHPYLNNDDNDGDQWGKILFSEEDNSFVSGLAKQLDMQSQVSQQIVAIDDQGKETQVETHFLFEDKTTDVNYINVDVTDFVRDLAADQGDLTVDDGKPITKTQIQGFIDARVYERLKEKERVMLAAIEGETLIPEMSNDYLQDIQKILGW